VFSSYTYIVILLTEVSLLVVESLLNIICSFLWRVGQFLCIFWKVQKVSSGLFLNGGGVNFNFIFFRGRRKTVLSSRPQRRVFLLIEMQMFLFLEWQSQARAFYILRM
jgi:hypothetical protein